MRRKKKPIIFLILTALSFTVMLLMILLLSPTSSFSLGFLSLSYINIFFIPLIIFLFSLPSYFLRSRKHGILLSVFIILFLLLRLNGLSHPIFALILLGIFLTLELFFSNRQ